MTLLKITGIIKNGWLLKKTFLGIIPLTLFLFLPLCPSNGNTPFVLPASVQVPVMWFHWHAPSWKERLEVSPVTLFICHFSSHSAYRKHLLDSQIGGRKKIMCSLCGWWHLNNFSQLAWLANTQILTCSQSLSWDKLPTLPFLGFQICWKLPFLPSDFSFALFFPTLQIKPFLLNANITKA